MILRLLFEIINEQAMLTTLLYPPGGSRALSSLELAVGLRFFVPIILNLRFHPPMLSFQCFLLPLVVNYLLNQQS